MKDKAESLLNYLATNCLITTFRFSVVSSPAGTFSEVKPSGIPI